MKLSNSNLRKPAFLFSFVLLCTALFGIVKPVESTEIQLGNGQTEDSIFAVVEKMPQFPGGESARIEFLKQNVHYPEEAQKNQEQGRVIVQFVVNSLGEIKNAKIVKSISPSLNQEALRVINSFPAWIPGSQNGKLVSVYQVMPVSFKLTSVPKDSITWNVNDSTIIMIDSLKMPSNFNLSIINPDCVVSVTVLKPFPEETKARLIKRYGTLAKNGVILVKTKTEEFETFKFMPDTTTSISDSSKIQTKPEFPGGEDELFKFLRNKIRYPVIALEKGIQGKVVIQFIITSSGKIENITISKSVNHYLDLEAMRLIKLLPDWTPGKISGKPVNVRYTLPVNFRISGSDSRISVLNNSKMNEIYVTASMSNYIPEPDWQRNDKTIVILDNKRLPSGFDVSLILINNLKKYVVLKPEDKSKTKKLVEQYGPDAVNGVIIITSRDQIMDNRVENDSFGNKVYDVIEQMPEFPGGDAALLRFLSNNIKYPIVAAENHIQGTVICFFVVESDGSVSTVQVARGVDKLLDNEAVRVIKSMPNWIPGKQKGVCVSVRYTLPIGFRL